MKTSSHLSKLKTRSRSETLVRAFIKKGYKEKAFKIVLNIFEKLKFRKRLKPDIFFNLALQRIETRFELRVNKFMKPPKKQKGRPKLRGRVFHVGGARVRRRAVKDLLLNSSLRTEETMVDRVVEEIAAICRFRGVSLKKKKEFYSSIKGARATLEVIKRHRRRKRINHL